MICAESILSAMKAAAEKDAGSFLRGDPVGHPSLKNICTFISSEKEIALLADRLADGNVSPVWVPLKEVFKWSTLTGETLALAEIEALRIMRIEGPPN